MIQAGGVRYAGVALPLVNPELEGYLRSFMDTTNLHWFDPLIGGAGGNCRAYFARQPRFELSKFIWPNDASRFACGLFVATQAQYTTILAKVDAATPRVPAKLEIGQSSGTSIISTDMYLLDPVHVVGVPGSDQSLYLLPLVDSRYFFMQGAPAAWDLTGKDTWDTWFDEAFLGLGVGTYWGPVIATEYRKPGGLYYPQANTPFLPLILDSAAFTVNRRVVKKLNGNWELVDATTGTTRHKEVQGQAVSAGGRQKKLRQVLPETCSFTWHNGATYDYDVASLRTWGADFNWYGVKQFYMRCERPSGVDAEVDATCELFSEEYLLWKTVRPDITFPGVVSVPLSGGEDRFEVTVNTEACNTRIFGRHYDFVDSLSIRWGALATANCDDCTGGGTTNCLHVSSVQCSGGILNVAYDTDCVPT